MNKSSHTYTAVINKEADWYVSRCLELGVVSQGRMIEEAKINLKEALELYVESFGAEDLPQVSLRLCAMAARGRMADFSSNFSG